jgi:hypothetical protein
MTHEKLLDRLRKLKEHADSAEKIGSEAEALAFASMFQKLLLENKLEMTDLEFEVMEKEEPVETHRLDYTLYPDIKIAKSRVAWQERLAGVIASAHFCRILVCPGTSRIALVGRKEDIAVAEYMYITLLRVTDRLAKNEHSKFAWECYKRDGSCYQARGFKASFTQAFIMRLALRYELEKGRVSSVGTAMVRFNSAEKAVEDFIKEEYKKNASSLTTHTAFHREGSLRGTAAADRIELRSNGLTANSMKAITR